MNINSEIWGEPLVEYWGYNVRTGAADLTDPDFDTYEPFIRNNMNPDYVSPLGETFTYSLRAGYYKENSPFEFNVDYPDYSVAYIGVQNPDMPQCNIECYGPSDDSPAGDTKGVPCFKTDPNGVAAIAFVSDRPMRSYRNVSQYSVPSNEFQNITYKNSQGIPTNGVWCLSPYYRDVTNAWVNRNHALDCAYWRSLGLRTFFGVIYVNYCDATVNSHNIPTKYDYNPVTLHWYETQTADWKEAHPIYQAYLKMCIRRNTNGLYAFTLNPADGIMPDLTYNLKINPNYVTFLEPNVKLLSPSTMFGDGNDYVQWPLFGRNKRDTLIGQWPSAPATGGMPSGAYPMFVGANKGQQHKGTGSTTYERQMYITYDDNNYEWFRQGAAAYGVFFTDGDANDDGYADLFAAGNDNYRWVNDKMCLGIVDENGLTHGEYTRGMSNPTAPNWNWANTTQSPYNPALPPGDPTIYDSETGFNLLGGVANCNKMYATTAANVMMLAKALSTALNLNAAAAEPMPPLDYSIQTFLTNNPLDCVVSLRKYPTADLTDSAAFEPIEFGSYSNSTVLGVPFVKSFEKVDFNFSVAARNALYAHFGDFRDYEPYTHAELIVPFCGTVPINPAEFIGHDINVHMIIDYITGACTAYIAADGLVITSISGSCAVDVPLSGIQQATLESQRVNAVMNRKSAEINGENAIIGGFVSSVGFAGALMGDTAVGAIGAGAGLLQSISRFQQADIAYQKADYDVKHMQVPYKQVSAGSPVAGTVIEHKCRLIIYRPVMDDKYNAEQYAETVGFACLMNGTIESLGLTGLTVANINTDGLILTETEKQMIQKAFASGVII